MKYQLDTRILDKLIRDNPANLGRFMQAVATDIVSDVQLNFSDTSPSPVGSPPGVDTTTLKGSMHVRPISQLTYYVEDGTEYGIVHELGLNGYPRPFVNPAFERARQHFVEAAKAWGILKP